MRRLIWFGLSMALMGCSTNLSDLVKAAGQDPATVCVSVSTVYGIVKFARTNIQSGNISCSQEGLTVKSDAAHVGVPIMVTPQISVAPAVVK